MRIIFDENVPWPLRNFLPDREVTSVQREGLGGSENGELLAALDGRFEVFILCDKNLRYQQNLTSRRITIVELPTNRWPVVKNLVESIVRTLSVCTPGAYLTIEEDTEQPGAGQPAARPVDEPEGGDKPQPEAEGRSR